MAVDSENKLVGKDNAYAQTKFILEKLSAVLKEAGFNLSDVVRTPDLRNRHQPVGRGWPRTWRILQIH